MGLLSQWTESRSRSASGLSQPTDWLASMFGGAPASSGAKVTQDTAMSLTAVFAAVRRHADTLAHLPLPVMARRTEGRGADARPEHALHTVLNVSPNGEQTAMEWRSMMQGHTLLGGTSYAEIVRNGAGAVAELWPIVPTRIAPRRREDGVLWYEVSVPNGPPVALAHERVLRVPGFSLGGLLGESTLDRMRETYGLALAVREYGARYYGNGARPGGVLSHPGKVSPEAKEKMRESWERMHSGLSNGHRVALLEEGITFTRFDSDPQKAQALETQRFSVEEVARIFDIPPHMLAELSRATFSNIEHQGLDWVLRLALWCVRWEQRFALSLFTPAERQRLYVKHVVQALLRGDAKSRSEFYKAMREMGVFSADDIRDLEDLNPIGGAAGTTYLVPLNMINAEFAAEPPAPKEPPAPAPAPAPADPEEDRAGRRGLLRTRHAGAWGRVIQDQAQRAVTAEINAVRRELRRRGADEVGFRAWFDTYLETRAADWTRALSGVLHGYAEAVEAEVRDGDADPVLVRFVGAYTSDLASAEVQGFGEAVRSALQASGVAGVESILNTRDQVHAAELRERVAVPLWDAVASFIQSS